jgi:AhpC/TSA family
LRDAHQKFLDRGADVAAVTQGGVAATASLCQRHSVGFRCLADPKCQAYKAYALGRGGVLEIMGPQVMLKTARSMLRGNFGAPGGDIFQLAGAFVIGGDGLIRLARYGRDASDMSPPDVLLAAT